MRIFLSLILVSVQSFAACDFKPKVSKVVSLSGVTTVLFKELNLLSHPKLAGISIFNPISAQEYKGKVYSGGLFFSRSSFQELRGSVVFFDESRELRRSFSEFSSIESKEIKTRKLTPFEAFQTSLEEVRPYLKDCDKPVADLSVRFHNLEKKLLKLIPEKFMAVFYLGEFRGGRPPEMVLSNDGVVKWLRDQKKLITYPSPLPYVNWSAKVMQGLPAKILHVGLKDSGREKNMELKRSSEKMTLIYPGSLVPGITQLEAFIYLFESL